MYNCGCGRITGKDAVTDCAVGWPQSDSNVNQQTRGTSERNDIYAAAAVIWSFHIITPLLYTSQQLFSHSRSAD